jgi:hypothetical protein
MRLVMPGRRGLVYNYKPEIEVTRYNMRKVNLQGNNAIKTDMHK